MKKVLIIDDEYNNCLLLEEILQDYKEQLYIIYTENAKKGLKFIKENNPDIIFLDIMLPVINGLEIINIVKNKWNMKEVKIVLITAKNINLGENEKHIDSYVKKPYKSQTIFNILDNILEGNNSFRG